MLRLWLTAMLRGTRLAVSDEVENGLAYFRLTFLDELPRLYAEFEDACRQKYRASMRGLAAAFLTVGTWIGGDRDGNPYVTAEVMRAALAQQARLVLAHYLEEVGLLGKELALSARIRAAPPDRGARRCSGENSATGATSRIAARSSGIYARLAARELRLQANPPPTAAAAYSSGGSAADLDHCRFAGSAGRRPPGARTAGDAAAEGEPVRLPPRAARPAAELERARARGGRAAGARRRLRGLRGAGRSRAGKISW